MTDFKPNAPYNVPFFLLVPKYQTIKGVRKKVFEKLDTVYFCSFRTFGGTERIDNDILVVEDTAVIETWYDPNILSECMIELENGTQYEILGTPENINMRNQYLKFKVRSVKGGA